MCILGKAQMSIGFMSFDAAGRPSLEGPNFNNGNALAVLRAAGLVSTEASLWSPPHVPIGQFRQRLRSGLHPARLEANVRAERSGQRMLVGALDEEAIFDRLLELLLWAGRAADGGAVRVSWA